MSTRLIDTINVDARTVTPRDPWLGGERPAIERRSALAAEAFKRDPEAARGAAFGRLAAPGPIDVTGKVQLEGQGTVQVNVKVEGGTVTGQYATSQGNIAVRTGTSMPGAKAANNGRVAGPN